jgi:hypothetical protein
VIGLSSSSGELVVVSQVSLYGAGNFDGSKRITPVATFSHPL